MSISATAFRSVACVAVLARPPEVANDSIVPPRDVLADPPLLERLLDGPSAIGPLPDTVRDAARLVLAEPSAEAAAAAAGFEYGPTATEAGSDPEDGASGGRLVVVPMNFIAAWLAAVIEKPDPPPKLP